MDKLMDKSSKMFREFTRNLEAAVDECLPETVPYIMDIIEYCKANNRNHENKLDPGYADLYAWYEDIDGYDALVMKDQNVAFLLLKTTHSSINVYHLDYFYKLEKMKPSIDDFKTIVVPYLKKKSLKLANLFNPLHINECLKNILLDETEKCSIKELVSLSYYKVDDEIFKNCLVISGFDYISDIKILNSFENQIIQYNFAIKENS